jgi:hypothetical protein
MIHKNTPFPDMMVSSIHNKSARLEESLDKTGNDDGRR